MASRLEQLATAIQAHVAGPAYAFGRIATHEQDRYPRVVWVPQNPDRYEAAQYSGHARTRRTTLAALIWGRTLEQTETIAESLVAAADVEAGAALVEATGEWFTQDDPRAGNLAQREGYQLSLTFALPVLALPDDTTTVVVEATDFDATPAVHGDGVLHAGEE